MAAMVLVATAPHAAPWSLEKCVQAALKQSRLVRGADLNLELAQKQVSEAWSGLFPTVDGNLSYTRNLTANEVFFPRIILDNTAPPDEFIAIDFSQKNNWLATVAFDQPLFRAEALIGVGAAKRFRNLREEELRGRQLETATRTRRSYYELLLAQENVRLIDESLRRIQQSLDESRAMNRAGLVSNYDVLRLEVEWEAVSASREQAGDAVAAARRQLNITMGIGVHQPTEVVGRLVDIDPQDTHTTAPFATVPEVATPAGAWQLGRENRSDLRQLRLLRLLNEAQLGAARAAFFPKLSAFANYQLTAQENGRPNFFGEDENDRTSAWQAGLRLEVPIFDGPGRPARASQRRIEIERVEAQLVEAEEQARAQIAGALDRLEESATRASAQARAVAQARRGFEIASLEFREGIGSQLQVTDSEEALRRSEFNYALAVRDYLAAAADFDLAIGIIPGVAPAQGDS